MIINIFNSTLLAQSSIKKTVTASSLSEKATTEIKPLSVGNQVPDITFHNVLNYKNKTAKLSDFKGKMVILDFWATWCGSCIDVFPKVEQLQKKFDKNVQFILVNSFKATHDTEKKVRDFFTKWKSKYGKAFSVPCAIDDIQAKRLFVHSAMPHYVWIGGNGIVKAFTSRDELNEANIQEALSNESFRIKEKIDFIYDKPMFLGENIDLDKFANYSLFIKGKVDDVYRIFKFRLGTASDGSAVIRGWAARNVFLLELFLTTFKSNPENGKYHYQKQLVLEVSNPGELSFDASKSDLDSWERNNLYTYDFLVPVDKADSVFHFMRYDLNHHTKFKAEMEKRKVKCWVMRKMNPPKSDRLLENKAGGEFLALEILTAMINTSDEIDLPLFDETNYLEKIKVDVNSDLKSIYALRKVLGINGIEIIEGVREMDMYVIRDKK